jgi:hypothetical protein
MCHMYLSLFIFNIAYTRCDQKVSRQYFILSDNSIFFVVHARPFKVLPLLLDTMSPVNVPPLESIANIFFIRTGSAVCSFLESCWCCGIPCPIVPALCFREERNCWALDLGIREGAGQQSHNNWWGIPSYTKQGEQKHCNGRETNLQCTTCQVVFTAPFPIDVVERLHWSIGSQFVPVEFTHDEHFCAFLKKLTACTSHRDKLSGLLQAWTWWILPWRLFWVCFIVLPVNLMFHHLLWSLKEMASPFIVSH